MTLDEFENLNDPRIAALRPLIGHHVDLLLIGSRTDQGFKILDPKSRTNGELEIVNRDGGPAVHIVGRGYNFFVTSWVVSSRRSEDGVEFETENSLYLAKPI